MYCLDTAVIGHLLCLAQLQRNLYFGRMMSEKVKNQMVCPFNMKDLLLSLKRTVPAHTWISSCSLKNASSTLHFNSRKGAQHAQFRLFTNLFGSGCVFHHLLVYCFIVILKTVVIRKIHNVLCISVVTTFVSINYITLTTFLNNYSGIQRKCQNSVEKHYISVNMPHKQM